MKPPQAKGSEFAVLLRMNPLFSDLEPRIIDKLASLCFTRHVQAGEILCQKGDPGDAMYGVRRGQIRIETGTRTGARVTLNLLGAGDLFGEIALLDGRERTADVVAVEPSELFALKREQLLDYFMQEPIVAIKFIELLCGRLRHISNQMEEAMTMSLATRLARRLTTLAADFGTEVMMSQEELATYVGSARESVNRQLQVWQRAGYIELKRGRILLKDVGALTAEARSRA